MTDKVTQKRRHFKDAVQNFNIKSVYNYYRKKNLNYYTSELLSKKI